MYLLLVILMVIASVLMCFIVLIQNSKGGGLASGFSSSNQIMGVRKTTDFLEKATWSLAVFLVVMSVASAYVIPSVSHKGGDVILEQAQQEEKTNPYNMPVGTAAPQAEQPARQPRRQQLLLPRTLQNRLQTNIREITEFLDRWNCTINIVQFCLFLFMVFYI